MLTTVIILASLLSPHSGHAAKKAAEPVCIDDITAYAVKEEKARIEHLLQQVAFNSEFDPKTQKMVDRVIRVDKGSIYERKGLKVGDVIATSCAKHEQAGKPPPGVEKAAKPAPKQ